jgi:ABC-type phosphate transport system auxiliary subunit
MGKAAGKLTGGFSAIGTLKMDTEEVALAEKILREVKKRLQKVQAEYDQTAKLAAKQAAEIGKHQVQFAKALKVYDSSARKFKSQRRRREGALKEFKQWK